MPQARSDLATARRVPPATLDELRLRAEALEGRAVGELAQALGVSLPESPRRAKGFVGTLVELALGADADAGDGPDFIRLGVELKTVPIGAGGRPAESTFCCSIRMAEADVETWETSRLKRRLTHVLWLPVDAARVAPLAARRFGRARLWRPSADEWARLRADWEDLMGVIGMGDAEALSGEAGAVLQVRPKAADASVRVWAPGPDGPERVLPLGFYLRASFTAQILMPIRDRG